MRKNAGVPRMIGLPLIALLGLVLGLAARIPADRAEPEEALPGQEKVTKQDFNGDGVLDTLTAMNSAGSGFGGDFITLKDGRTGRTFDYSNWGSYGQFLCLIPFDNELMKPENKGFKAALEGALFPEIPLGKIDGSLAWLIDAYSGAARGSEGASDAISSQEIRFVPRWTDGEPVAPATYYLVTSDEALLRGYPVNTENRNPKPDADHRQAWLAYYGHNHQALELAAASGEVKVYKSAHGVVVSEGGRSCWIFVNDGALTDGPDKLRWPSIGNVFLREGLVLIQHKGGPGLEEHLFVVDYRSGVAVRRKEEALATTDLAILKERLRGLR